MQRIFGDSAFVTEEGYPSFTPCFAPHFEVGGGLTYPLCLVLLNLIFSNDADEKRAINMVRDCVKQSGNISSEVEALFAGYYYRSHLIGAFSILLSANTDATIQALWSAFDRGSWVTPQLAVTAFLRDPNFEINARHRILAGCPVELNETVSAPHQNDEHSRKPLASLIFLCRQRPAAADWLNVALADERIRYLSNDEWDRGDSITADWQEGIQKVLSSEAAPNG